MSGFASVMSSDSKDLQKSSTGRGRPKSHCDIRGIPAKFEQ